MKTTTEINENPFQNYSNEELVKRFNNEVGNTGWGDARAKYLVDLSNEMSCREIDFGLVANNGSLKLDKRIKLDDMNVKFDTEDLSIETYTAILNIGLQNNYTNEYFTKNDYILYLQQKQRELLEKEIHLSAAVSEYELVYGNLIEKHLQIRFVNYPKFPLSKEEFKIHTSELAKRMMAKFNQNRILVEYTDYTVVFENNTEVDPKITNY